jgi:hypothetical protein
MMMMGDDAVVPPGDDGATMDSTTPQPDTGGQPMDAGDGGGLTAEGGGDGGPAPLHITCDVAGKLVSNRPLVAEANFQRLVRACVMAQSCDPAYFAVTLSECLSKDYLEATPAFTCLASATDCTGYFACIGRSVMTFDNCMGDAAVQERCANNVAYSCSGGQSTRTNCAAVGGTCTKFSSGGFTELGCKVLTTACSPPDSTDNCATGNKYYHCELNDATDGGIGLGYTCPTGTTCSATDPLRHCDPNLTACTPNGDTCTTDGQLKACSGGQGATYNCRATGMTCLPSVAANAGECYAPGCEQSGCSEACDTTTGIIHTCLGGTPSGGAGYDVDCTKYGFVNCDMGQGHAYCYF